jgi:hypothetical protein
MDTPSKALTKQKYAPAGLTVKQRDACDGILRGLDPASAMFAAGYTPDSSVNQFLKSAKVRRYLSWAEKRKMVRVEEIEEDANLRLVRMLEDDAVPPMVHALLIRTAHEYVQTLRDFRVPAPQPGEAGVITAIAIIKRKLAANTAPSMKTFEEVAQVVEHRLVEEYKAQSK